MPRHCERVALLPLIRRVQNGIRIVEFADLDLTDYNAPMLGCRGAARRGGGARAVARSAGGAAADCPAAPISFACARCRPISTACPIRWRCSMVQGRVRSTAMSSRPAMISTPTGYSLERTVRKELERSWRVFKRDPAAAFRIVTDQKRGAARARDHGYAAGCADAASRIEFRSQRRDLLPRSTAIWSAKISTAAMPWCRR